jgi:hypothetical protein
MTSEERIEKIEEHFNDISIEEFENNLSESGYGIIKSASEDGMRLSFRSIGYDISDAKKDITEDIYNKYYDNSSYEMMTSAHIGDAA